MFIDKLNIKNFKGFTDLSLTFKDRITVIIGNNGAGKSSILDALSISAGCYLIPLGGGEKFQRTIKKSEVHLKETSDAVFERQLPCFIEAEGSYGSWKRAIEKISFSNTVKDTKDITNTSSLELKLATTGGDVVLPVFAYHSTGRLWVEKNDTAKYTPQGSRLEGYEGCFSAKSSSKAFRNWYKTLEKNSDKKNSQEVRTRLDLFRHAIIECLDDWNDIYYDFAEDDIIGVQKQKDGTLLRMPYRYMSDGYRSMLGMIADIAYRCIKLNPQLGEKVLQETPGLVLIDEIDLHLHPLWQRHIIAELSKAFPKIQFVATTHSPFIVQSLKANQLINLEGEILRQNPNQVSLETNALYMGVKSTQSEAFDDKNAIAKRFYSLLQEDKEAQRGAEAQKIVDDYLLKYTDDPLFKAKLQLEMSLKYNK